MTALRASCCLGALLFSAAALADFGDPLPGLTAAELAVFEAGKIEFSNADDLPEGLGPVFNETSCKACHLGPGTAVGGTTQRMERRFGRLTNGTFDPLAQFGGSLIQDHGIGRIYKTLPNGTTMSYDFVGETIPSEANVTAFRRTPPLFGLGLVDATPDSTFIGLAIVQQIFNRSIAGTVSVVSDPSKGGRSSLGKFGWKAQVPSLFVFSADAYLNEMGVTSPLFPKENCPGSGPGPECDYALSFNPALTSPNDVNGANVAQFNDFMTFLGAPPRGPRNFFTEYGNIVASAIGCLDCHVQTLHTGPNAVAALNHVTFHPFSDFLLHDMGSLGDGITQNLATGKLMRTQPLWGLRTQTRMLHDGRALNIRDAILAHDGQGAESRRAFESLSAFDRLALSAFLNSL